MITPENIIIFLSIIITILINLFINRDKTYLVFVKDINKNKIFKVVVKASNKKKVYEVVSRDFMKKNIPFIIGDITNTIYLDDNSVICTDIFLSIK